ncbi:MAG: extracellular solute-binding protein [Syntrophomonadaceae bacterium]|nr:extracellular solute-binding protein [Syntrophomonadaceae bacterium]
MRKLFKNKKFAVLIMAIFLMGALAGCGNGADNNADNNTPAPAPAPENPQIKMATTTSTQDSGLLDAILPEFTKDTGYEIEVIAVGTGAAIKMGETGDVDVILVHSRAAEDKFVEDGFGVDRKDVMYNDFLFIGPKDDPAGIKGTDDAVAALKAIAEKQATFVSRGDDSGTHKKEVKTWAAAGIEPAGEWYKSVGKGMGDTYRMADEMKGYTLIDRATFLANQDKYELEAMVEGDKLLLNPYGVIAVNPEKYPNVNNDGALAFIEWMTSEKGQKLIGEYGVDEFGQALFVPDAK